VPERGRPYVEELLERSNGVAREDRPRRSHQWQTRTLIQQGFEIAEELSEAAPRRPVRFDGKIRIYMERTQRIVRIVVSLVVM